MNDNTFESLEETKRGEPETMEEVFEAYAEKKILQGHDPKWVKKKIKKHAPQYQKVVGNVIAKATIPKPQSVIISHTVLTDRIGKWLVYSLVVLLLFLVAIHIYILMFKPEMLSNMSTSNGLQMFMKEIVQMITNNGN